MRYLLDTNIVSDLVRNPQGKAAQHIREVGEESICTSIIVAAELRFGAAKKGSPRLSKQLDAILGPVDILPFAVPADEIYGSQRAKLERVGRIVGGNDLLIAAHAVAHGHTLVTDNMREFAHIDGLRCENWLR